MTQRRPAPDLHSLDEGTAKWLTALTSIPMPFPTG
jgi:hypothetical protein